MQLSARLLLHATAVASIAFAAHAQCPGWSSSFAASNGIYSGGYGLSAAVFDDGHGPALFVGGLFHSVAGVPAERIARWDGTSWSALGAGIDLRVHALCVFDDGHGAALYAGGDFTSAGGAPASHIAKWDGTSWSPLGSGIDGIVYSLATYDDGNGTALYVGGAFTTAGGVVVNNIARWDGSSWSALAGGTSGSVFTMTPIDDGHGRSLFVGGSSIYAGGFQVSGAARWDRDHFQYMDAGFTDSLGYPASSTCSIVFDSGNGPALYVGGNFASASFLPAANIARWDPAGAWRAVGGGLPGPVGVLCAFDDGGGEALYAMTAPTSAGATSLVKWTGSTWTSVADFDAGVRDLAIFGDGASAPALFAIGTFESVAGVPSRRVARFDGCATAGIAYCFGDGSGVSCPCGNDSHPGAREGCANSLGHGATLRASGDASLSNDTLVLAGGGMPNTTALYFQGTLAPNSGLGTPFGDGLRCAGGSSRRLGTKANASGASRLPDSGDAPLSLRGGVSSSGVRRYQCWYRNAAMFCTASTVNTTNGWETVWHL